MDALESVVRAVAPGIEVRQFGRLGGRAEDFEQDFRALQRPPAPDVGRIVLVWGCTPRDPTVGPVESWRFVTPIEVAYTWAVQSRASTSLQVLILDAGVERERATACELLAARARGRDCNDWLQYYLATDPGDLALFLEALGRPVGTIAPTPSLGLLRTLVLAPLMGSVAADPGAFGHHDVANLVGPLLLLRAMAHAPAGHRDMLRQLLAAAGVLGEQRPAPDRDTVTGRTEVTRRCLGIERGDVRFVLCDDQWWGGWIDWLCERTGATLMPAVAQKARSQPSGDPTRVAERNGISIWVVSSPEWLLRRMRTLLAERRPLRRRLSLTGENVEAEEVLLLDLRLFSGRPDREKAFLAELRGLLANLGDARSRAEIPAEVRAEELSLLPRAVALADPLVPIVLFSSTSMRDVTRLLGDRANIVTAFAKPRVLGDAIEAVRERAEAQLDAALAETAHVVGRRLAVERLQAAHDRVRGVQAGRSRGQAHGYVGIYMDESGSASILRETFVMAAIVALCKDRSQAQRLEENLRRGWPRVKGRDATPEQKRELANRVSKAAEDEGVVLRGVALSRGQSLPDGPRYGPHPRWAGTAIDRVHKLLVKQTVVSALLYAVDPEELSRSAKCAVLTDVRTMPIGDLRSEKGESVDPFDVLRFGVDVLGKESDGDESDPGAPNRVLSRSKVKKAFYGLVPGQPVPEAKGWKWLFLTPSGVLPIVEDAFAEEERLMGRYVVDEARACRNLRDGGHPLVEFADYLANTVYRAEGRMDRLDAWARDLLAPPGLLSTLDVHVDRLLELAREASHGDVPGAIRRLAHRPDTCGEHGPHSLADRCRASIYAEIERVMEGA